MTELFLDLQLGVSTVLEKLLFVPMVCARGLYSHMLVWEQPLGVLLLYPREERGGNNEGEGNWSGREGQQMLCEEIRPCC